MRRSTKELEAVRALVRMSRLLERSSDELSLSHYRVLTAIAAGDERASRLAQRLALGKPAISAAVDVLCKRGLLDRTGVEGDQRATSLSVTAAGHAQLASVEAAMLATLQSVLVRAEDPDTVVDALRQLSPALDALVAEQHAARPGAAR